MTGYSPTELLTLRDLVRWGASRFNEAGLCFGHGTDNAYDEALVLVCHAVHLPPRLPEGYLDSRVTAQERDRIVSLLNERITSRKPVAYLTHEAWFAGMSFYVDERVLVPRSPLAEWVEQGFEPWLQANSVTQVLDLCTGSGCIAIACARAFPQASVDAVDVSEAALDVTRKNIERYHLQGKVRPVKSNLFENLDGHRYQLIITNPPYVSEQEMECLPDEYRHEPVLGLAAGKEGLDIAVRILCDAVDYLDHAGILAMEVGNSQVALQECFPEVPFLWLEFERGGHGVLLLEAHQLEHYHDVFCNLLAEK